ISTYFTSPRPVYELYDLDADPSELNNIDFAMKSLLARPASDSERAALKALLDDLLETYSRDSPAAEAITRIGQGPRDTTVPVADLAAWTGVASALFNLDEAVTRE
ncbi:MAG: hypothetical protein ACKPAH_11880, partial [Verrucomicrobiota bacterium]